MTRSRGFTLIDLLMIVGILVVLALILLSALYTMRKLHMRPMCASNLRNTGTGLAMYASVDERDVPPILPDIDQSEPVDYRQGLRMGADCTAEALGTGAQQNLCLLVKENYITWELLLCPSSGSVRAERDTEERKYGLGEVVNGEHKSYIDYALQIPYARTSEGGNSAPWTMYMDTAVAIMADRGPRDDFRRQWSPNHENEGEHVLYADLHADWREDEDPDGSLNASGFDGNNIYTADVWEGTPEKPKLKSNGTENKTPTDENATKDSVLYHWW